MHLDAALGARGLTQAAALAERLFGFHFLLHPALCFVFGQADGIIGADIQAQRTAVAFVRHKGFDRIQMHHVPGQNHPGAGGRGLGLGDRLFHGFGIIGQAGHKQAVHGQIHRPQLGMGLIQEAVEIGGALEKRHQVTDLIGLNGRGQKQVIRLDRKLPADNRIGDPDQKIPAFSGYRRFALRIKPDKHDAPLPGFGVEILMGPIGTDVPVKDEHIHLRIQFFK